MFYEVRLVCEIKEGERFVERREVISPQAAAVLLVGALDNGIRTANGFIQARQILGVGVFVCNGTGLVLSVEELTEILVEGEGHGGGHGGGHGHKADVASEEPSPQPSPRMGEGEEEDAALDGLVALLGVGEEIAEALYNAGIRSVEDVRVATDKELVAVPGIGKATLAGIRKQLA